MPRLINRSHATCYVSGLSIRVDVINLEKFLAFVLALAKLFVVSIEENNF